MIFFSYKNYLLKVDENIECDEIIISNFVSCLKEGIIIKKESLKDFIENNKVSFFVLPVNTEKLSKDECENICRTHQKNPYTLDTLQSIVETSYRQLIFKKI